MLVTTSYEAAESVISEARRIAEETGGIWAPRGRSSLQQLRAKHRDDRLLLMDNEGLLKYYEGNAAPLYFHPSSAMLRVKRNLLGEADPLLEASGAVPGDRVLDCTAGLGSDAIVFADRVGQQGSVTAVESSAVLLWIVARGLRNYRSGLEPLDAAMRRVRLVPGDHLDYLRRAPDKSVDIVYFDPMFRSPLQDSVHLQPMRQLANTSPISVEAIREAVRAARKCVVLKETARSREFVRLGFADVRRTHSKIAYGVIRR